jgi:hypothetical protein
MMAMMNRGMSGAQLMPASTAPATAMRGYDLGSAADLERGVSGGVQFEALRNPLETVMNVLKLFGS